MRTASLPERREFFQSLKMEKSGTLLSPLLLCGRLYELFDWLRQRQSVPAAISAPEQYVRRAAEYIRANFARPITVEGLAGAMGIDRRYFSRIFTESMGISPQAYLVGFRLEKAAALLADRRCTVGEAARAWAMRTRSSFPACIKSGMGCLPPPPWPPGRCPGRKRMRGPLMRAIRPPMAKPWIFGDLPPVLLGTTCASRSGGIQWP